MPNAVDITKVPFYSNISSTDAKTFIRQMVIYFNTNFSAIINQARATRPDLTIHMPDFFALLDNMAAYPAIYGLIKPDKYVVGGDPDLSDYSLTGPGTNYLWWDYQDPTAKANEIMADVAQQLISPAATHQLTLLVGSNRLDAVNLPLGLNGFVDGRASLLAGNWTPLTNFPSTTATQAIFVPASAAGPFYRLRFPFAWSWP
jgi:phospholipase/lecithinase/hemolysin